MCVCTCINLQGWNVGGLLSFKLLSIMHVEDPYHPAVGFPLPYLFFSWALWSLRVMALTHLQQALTLYGRAVLKLNLAQWGLLNCVEAWHSQMVPERSFQTPLWLTPPMPNILIDHGFPDKAIQWEHLISDNRLVSKYNRNPDKTPEVQTSPLWLVLFIRESIWGHLGGLVG